MSKRTPTRRARLVLAFAACALLLALAPAADATGPEDEPVEYAQLSLRSMCRADEMTLAPASVEIVDGQERLRLAACAPLGFYPVRTEALCTGHGWWFGDTVCASSYSHSTTWFTWTPTNCAPLVFLESVQPVSYRPPDLDVCARPILSNAAKPPSPFQPTAPVCIEDPLVQGDTAAALLRAGDSFVSSENGTMYLIVMGGPTCTFGCYDGFDSDCDGKLGDYCPVEIDARSVQGVAACRAAEAT